MVTPNLIAPRSSWSPKYRDGVGTRAIGNLETYLHHTATSTPSASTSVAEEQRLVRGIEAIGQARFGAGMSYTVLVFPSGRAYQGVSANRISYHSGAGRNTRGYAICFVGNYETSKPTAAALRTASAILEHAVASGWSRKSIITEAHRDFRATACPGKNLYSQVSTINSGSAATGSGGGAAKPAPTSSKAWPAVALASTRQHTAASHSAWVKLLRDVGYKESKLAINLQRWLRDLRYYTRAIDGSFGAWSVRALQSFLRKRGYYTGLIDDDRGPMTVAAEIAYLNNQRKHY